MSLMNPLFRQNVTTFLKRNVRADQHDGLGLEPSFETRTHALLAKEQFQRMLLAEKKRAERSGKNLVLLLIDRSGEENQDETSVLLSEAAGSLSRVVRDTDITGWYQGNRVLGVIFTEFGGCDLNTAVNVIEKKVTHSLRTTFPAEPLSNFRISFYAFPEGWAENGRTTRIRPQVAGVRPRGTDLQEISAFSSATVPQLASKAAL